MGAEYLVVLKNGKRSDPSAESRVSCCNHGKQEELLMSKSRSKMEGDHENKDRVLMLLLFLHFKKQQNGELNAIRKLPMVLLSTACPTSPAGDQTKRGGRSCVERTPRSSAESERFG